MEVPDLPTSGTEKKTQFSSLRIPFFILLSSLLLSYPLYFIKLISFLSPLLITTFLILLFTSHRTVLEKLRGNGTCEKGQPELHFSEDGVDENEVYKIIFQASSQLEDGLREPEESIDKFLVSGDDGVSEFLQKKNLVGEDDNENDNNGDTKAEKTLDELFQEKEDGECEAVDIQVVEKTEGKEIKEADTEARNCDSVTNMEECASRVWMNSRRLSHSLKIFDRSSERFGEEKPSLVLGGFGSMRRTEKEWKRTLACKLFEERHSNGGSNTVRGEGDEEGMDLLWETYEKNERSSSVTKSGNSKKAVKESKKLQEEEEEEDDDDDEEEEMSRQACCLQALKMSAGKVNLGMGRPNIAKISKALRGIGWLHHVKARKGGLFH